MLRIAALYYIGNMVCFLIALAYTPWALVAQFIFLFAQLREHYLDNLYARFEKLKTSYNKDYTQASEKNLTNK